MNKDKVFNEIYKFKNFSKLLEEGLIHTYPIKTAVKIIKRELFPFDLKFKVEVEEETDSIFIKGYSESFVDVDILKIFRIISLCGYFPSTLQFYDIDDNLIDFIKYRELKNKKEEDSFISEVKSKNIKSYFIEIICEAKFNKRIYDVPKKLYHVTHFSDGKIDKILKNGLVPKSNSKRAFHTERIYMGFNLMATKNLAYQFDVKGVYILFEIDTQKIGSNKLLLKDYLRIYEDPDYFKGGCYTYQNIPPNCIKEVIKFDTSKK